jgi:hypothetical protein
MKQIRNMILFTIALSTLFVLGCTDATDYKTECEAAEGTWVGEANECEYISQEKCEELGGTFNECASACRNDPEAEICTMQCVLVCEFE